MSEEASSFTPVDARAAFVTTRWTMVLEAAHTSSADSDEAMAHLYSTYRYPLYAFVRRRGYSAEDAEDLTQGFFTHLLEKRSLHSVARHKGKFRSFLLASLKNFLANDWDRQHAAKRGGPQPIISWDNIDAEEKYAHEPANNLTPEKLFEQNWALTVIDAALQKLREEFAAAGKVTVFEVLQDRLIGAGESESYAELAAKFGMQEGAVRMTVLRMRRQFGSLLRSEIARTVEDPAEVEQELRHLISAMTR
jgi:RNA polymerase sigma factor (sigma-70 family)